MYLLLKNGEIIFQDNDIKNITKFKNELQLIFKRMGTRYLINNKFEIKYQEGNYIHIIL